MCIRDVNNANNQSGASSITTSALLGTVGCETQPIGTYDRASELVSGMTRYSPSGATST